MTTLKLKTARPEPRDRYEDRENWRLVDTERALEIKVGDTVKTRDGERHIVQYLQPPHKCSSQGKVTVQQKGRSWQDTWYASVVGCEYQYTGDLS